MFSKTVDGIEMDLWNLNPAIVTVRRIANTLARIDRYAGHWVSPISVARHGLMVADALKKQGCPVSTQLQGLFHDASEAFTQDIPAPFKSLLLVTLPQTEEQLLRYPPSSACGMPGLVKNRFPAASNFVAYHVFEEDLLERIFKQLGIPWPIASGVWTVDREMYSTELPIVCGTGDPGCYWSIDPNTVANLFVDRAKWLMGK